MKKEEVKQPLVENDTGAAQDQPPETGTAMQEATATEEDATEAAPAVRPLRDRLSKAFPDRELTDDGLDDVAIEYMDELEKYKISNDKLNSLFEQYPELVAFIRDVAKGATLAVAVARNIDLDELKPMEGDPDYEEWGNAAKERSEKIAQKKRMAEELTNNLDMSAKEVKAFAEKNKMSEQDVNKLLDAIDQLVGDIVNGKLTGATLDKMTKAVNYETDIAMAEKAGKAAGLNEQYDKRRRAEEEATGDGLPDLTGSGSEMAVKSDGKPKKEDPFFVAADEETKRRNRF